LHTKEKQEVDFILVQDNKPEQMIEAKYADASLAPSLLHFHEKYKIPAIQLVKELKRERVDQGVEILDATKYLRSLIL
jgi:hypothetical protein